MKKILPLVLALALLLSLSASAFADDVQGRAVIGADLSTEQVDKLYAMFGISRGSLPELTVTNQEERVYLSGFISEELLGTRAISSVLVELLPEGSGMDVSTVNITWCTPEMYKAALATAGITDARIVVAAPFEVSGTAALTGIYKAYEDITGQTLDEMSKLVGTQELTITGEIADAIGSMDSTSIVNQLKLVLTETEKMSDEEILAQIDAICTQYNVQLSDTHRQQLLSLCRSFEGLDAESLKAKVEDVQGKIKSLAGAKEKVEAVVEKAKGFVGSVGKFFDKVRDVIAVIKR